jgi:hypothetical protein
MDTQQIQDRVAVQHIVTLSISIYPKNRKDPLFYIQKTAGFLNRERSETHRTLKTEKS